MGTTNTKHVMLYGGTETTAPMALVSGGGRSPELGGQDLSRAGQRAVRRDVRLCTGGWSCERF